MVCGDAGGRLFLFCLVNGVWVRVAGALGVSSGYVVGCCFAHEAMYFMYEGGAMEALSAREHGRGGRGAEVSDRVTIQHVEQLIRERREVVGGDFVYAYDDSTLPPIHTGAVLGRPMYSRDRAGRTLKAKLIPAPEEALGMWTLSVIILHLRKGARDGDGWYVDSGVYDLFRRTRAGEAIHQWRHTHKGIAAQLRRWSHSCRRLVLETSAFTIPPPKEVAGAARVHKSVAWGRGRVKRICDLAAGWAHGGEAAAVVFPAAPPGVRMAEWIESQLSSGGDRARGARAAGVQQVSAAFSLAHPRSALDTLMPHPTSRRAPRWIGPCATCAERPWPRVATLARARPS